MTISEAEGYAGASRDGEGGRGIDALTELPVVSVIVVNYNYGRFLAEAVGSVLAQTYPRTECIVVDNASTDESAAVIERLGARHPALKVIWRESNDGQTPASLDGLAASQGQYVIFLDADDYLLPHCVETHVFVHLSMRKHVGLSSGDMLQVVGRQVVVSTGEESSRFIGRGRRRQPHLLRAFSSLPGWPAPAVRGAVDRAFYVAPLRVAWVWAPTSGLCYRRDALLLFADNPQLAKLRTGTDLYFAFGCSGLSGSVLIDEPLFAYRVHGGNIFTARPQLDRTLNFTVGGHGDSNITAQLFLVDHLVRRAARFTPNLLLKLHYLALLFRLDRADGGQADGDRPLPRWARRSRAARAMAQHWDEFAPALGAPLARAAFALFARSLRAPDALARSLPPGSIRGG